MKVSFYFDLLSPYTYFGWVLLKRYRPIWNLDVSFVPFHLGAVMTGSGNRPPAAVPSRGVFMTNDLRRNAKWFNLESTFKGFPSNAFTTLPKATVGLNRLLCVVMEDKRVAVDSKWKCVDAAFENIWEDQNFRNGSEYVVSQDIPGMLDGVLDSAGITGSLKGELLSSVNLGGKELLRRNTDTVLELGGFGSPIFTFPELKGEESNLFFGSDRFEQIAFLMGKRWYGPTPPENLQAKL